MFYLAPGAQREIPLQFGDSIINANPSDPETRARLKIKVADSGAQLPVSYDQPLCWLPQSMDNPSGGQVWAMTSKWGRYAITCSL